MAIWNYTHGQIIIKHKNPYDIMDIIGISPRDADEYLRAIEIVTNVMYSEKDFGDYIGKAGNVSKEASLKEMELVDHFFDLLNNSMNREENKFCFHEFYRGFMDDLAVYEWEYADDEETKIAIKFQTRSRNGFGGRAVEKWLIKYIPLIEEKYEVESAELVVNEDIGEFEYEVLYDGNTKLYRKHMGPHSTDDYSWSYTDECLSNPRYLAPKKMTIEEYNEYMKDWYEPPEEENEI